MEKEFVPYNRFLHQHDEDIKAEYPDRPTEAMAEELDMNYYTVSRKAKRLGVSKSETFMHASWKKGGNKNGRNVKAELREAIVKYMQAHFADTRNEDLARLFSVDVKTVRRWARRLGLVKDDAFMRVCRAKGRLGGRPFYTKEQIAHRNRRIAEVYPDADDETLQHLADELGVCVETVRHLACEAGIHRRSKYKKDFVDAFAAYFSTHTDKECAAEFGIGKPKVQYIARKYGLKKSEEHVRKMYDRNMATAQRFRHKSK